MIMANAIRYHRRLTTHNLRECKRLLVTETVTEGWMSSIKKSFCTLQLKLSIYIIRCDALLVLIGKCGSSAEFYFQFLPLFAQSITAVNSCLTLPNFLQPSAIFGNLYFYIFYNFGWKKHIGPELLFWALL